MNRENEVVKKTVLIVYEYFYPGYKAGGPIQSLVNLIGGLRGSFKFKVITTGYDLNETTPYPGVMLDSWNETSMFDGGEPIHVFYASPKSNLLGLLNAIIDAGPNYIYVNGIFGKWKLYLAFLHRLGTFPQVDFIIAPRGMLQKGAIATRQLKKKLFLSVFRILLLRKKVRWHATDNQEIADIKRNFGFDSEVLLASNIPKPIKPFHRTLKKEVGGLQLIFLSLIAEKKNLHVAIEALREIKTPISFHIYGPIKDEFYWKKCQKLMTNQIHEIKYFGPVSPLNVEDKLSEYHVMILPTKGENFGHVIYESLSTGTPVIISEFTPWGEVQRIKGGLVVNGNDSSSWADAINQFIYFNEQEYESFSKCAYELAKKYYDENEFELQYRSLFL